MKKCKNSHCGVEIWEGRKDEFCEDCRRLSIPILFARIAELEASCRKVCIAFNAWRYSDWWDNPEWDAVPTAVDAIGQLIKYEREESEVG